MRKHTILFLTIMVCSALAVVSAQKKPAQQQRSAQRQAGPSEQNKEVARRVFDDLFTQGRYGEIDQIYDRNCKVHFGNRTEGLSQAVAEGKGWRSAAPDLVMTANQISESGDKVTVHWTARGTHTGQGHGLKPTGKHILIHGASTFQIANGKIVEAWNDEYRDELFRQLGLPKTAASMVDTGQRLWSSVAQLFPDPLYASLQ